MLLVRGEREVRRFDEAKLDQGGPIVDDGEGEDVERRERVRQERVRDAVEAGHLARVHLGMHRHQKVDVGLVQKVQVLEGQRDAGLELGNQAVEAVLVGGRTEIERNVLQGRFAAGKDGLVQCGRVLEGQAAEGETSNREREERGILGFLKVGLAEKVGDACSE